MAPKEPLTLYYRRTIPGTNEPSVAEIQTTSSVNGTSSESFVGNLPMCDADYKKFNKDIINFIGTRVPEKKSVGLPAIYLETVTIISKPYQSENSANMITATSNYIDSGSGAATSVPYVNYTVTGASGKFAGYKFVKILYDQGPEQKRVVTLY
jgi:hypothetical protein